MRKLEFDHVGFKMDGRDQYMVSGEFHYFRVPAQDWKRRMELFKEAGGNCIATYVPWLIHEPEEGRIVFGDIPNRDLARFLETAREVGLAVVLRPGPYQYSELINAGLPTWLLENYPEAAAMDIRGELLYEHSVSYLNPVFLEKARRYYRAFADVVRPYMGDPVVMLQTDNELGGIHVWYGSLDYNTATMGQGTENGRYPTYLKKKYGTLNTVNEQYEISASSWSEVLPIEDGDRSKPAVCRRLQDYYDFYCGTLAEYTCLLTSWLREDGLHAPICHNSANPGMNAMFTEAVKEMGEGYLLGSDHYYTLNHGWRQNNPTPQYAISSFVSLEELRLLGMPPSVLEMPGGSPSDTPPILPEDLLACYMSHAALGMKGVNYYIYTGGPNFPNTGTTAEIYDYNAHVRADGSLNPTYESLKTFGHFMQSHGWMQRVKRRGSAVVGFEWNAARCDGRDYKGVPFTRTECWRFLQDGIVYTMMCSEMSPELTSLDRELDLSRPLIVPSPSVMSADAQQRLIDFVENGGQLLLVGDLPTLDENLHPCTLLREFMGNPEFEKQLRSGSMIRCESCGDVYNMLPLHVIKELPDGADVFCTAPRTGRAVGFAVKRKKGCARYLACRWVMNTFDQAAFMEAVLRDMDAVPCVRSSNRNLFTSLWEDAQGHCMTMVMNLYSGKQSTQITVYAPDGCVLREENLDLKPMEVRVLE